MKRSTLVRLSLSIVLASSLACAGLKTVLIKTYQTIETGLEKTDEAERIACFGKADITGMSDAQLQTCTVGLADASGKVTKPFISDALHRTISIKLRDAFAAQTRLGPVLDNWKSGDAIPKDFTTAQTAATDVLALVQAVDPSDKTAAIVAETKKWITSLDEMAQAFKK
jgi:hypothetical protein